MTAYVLFWGLFWPAPAPLETCRRIRRLLWFWPEFGLVRLITNKKLGDFGKRETRVRLAGPSNRFLHYRRGRELIGQAEELCGANRPRRRSSFQSNSVVRQKRISHVAIDGNALVDQQERGLSQVAAVIEVAARLQAAGMLSVETMTSHVAGQRACRTVQSAWSLLSPAA